MVFRDKAFYEYLSNAVSYLHLMVIAYFMILPAKKPRNQYRVRELGNPDVANTETETLIKCRLQTVHP